MQLHQIRYFLAVCETLSFTKAAELCNVSQPSLTRAIQGLEAELGGPVFSRDNRQVVLTDLGRLVRPRFERAMAETMRACEDAASLAQSDPVPLRVGIDQGIPCELLGDCLSSAHEAGGPLWVSVERDRATALIERLENGRLDCVIGEGQVRNDGLMCDPLLSVPYVVWQSARQKDLSPLCLQAPLPLPVLLNEDSGFLDALPTALRASIRTLIRCGQDDHDQWLDYLVEGRCITVQTGLRPVPKGIRSRPLAQADLTVALSLITRKSREASPDLSAFKDTLKQILGAAVKARPTLDRKPVGRPELGCHPQ